MKTRIYYIVAIMFITYACSSTKILSSSMEDDIYFVPGQKPLVVKEVEQLTGQPIHLDESEKSFSRSDVSSPNKTATVINSQKGRAEKVSIAQLSEQAQQQLADNDEINTTIYENPGYWIGGFKGSESDIDEAARVIARYPEGFGYIGNGQDIATNLSFNSDWNVYTENGRYWWFPSNSNIDLYTTFIFGTYPKYNWVMAWNSPFYDSWTFDSQFNINIGWGSPSLSIGFGTGFYNPWYNNWYGPQYGGGWYDPWWGGGYYPHWGHHHHHWDGPHWGGNYPSWDKPSRPTVPGIAQRPNLGGGISGIRPNPGSRPTVNGVRPGVTRPNGSTSAPIYGGSVRPGSGTRPGSVGNQPTTRPGNVATRPSTGTVRPGNVQTRPATSTTVRPTNSGVRPTNVTRPNNGQYTRPATNSSSSVNRGNSSTSVKNYSRPQNSNRPTYNNNSSSRYNSGSSMRQPTNRSSNSSYTPSNSGRSSQSTPPPTQRSTTRSGGTRR